MREILYVLILPLIFANIIHIFMVKVNALKWLKIPINEKLFGTNKTYRGFVIVIVLSSVFSTLGTYLMDDYSPFLGFKYGCLLGLGYVLFELPNSFLKRRLGIAPGTTPDKNKLLFNILDKTDSTLGVSLSYILISDIGWSNGGILFLTSVFLHATISIILVKLKVKKSF
jgi:hypothetical protein